jgi:hypothetical protein
MTPEDYRRWKTQKRYEILRYIPRPERYAQLGDTWIDWIDPTTGEVLQCCPFLVETDQGRYSCLIHDTKPRVCLEFWCEWSYRVGSRGVPFKRAGGWTRKARELGYDAPSSIA